MHKVFIAATQQNDGKTTVSLGLIAALQNRGLRVGFIKPVGQRYLEVDGQKLDEDAVLVADAAGLEGELAAMSPVAVESRFTREYIDHPTPNDLLQRIHTAFERAAYEKDFIVVEGTGHAGVGSCFDLSNAHVAQELQCGVILVSGGGIGRPIDEIMLNRALFAAHEVPILGAIINRALPEKLEMIRDYVQRGLARLGIPLLGVIPLRPRLSSPTVRQVLEELRGELLNGGDSLDDTIERCVIGAMSPHHALHHFGRGVLAIVPGDREDLILAAMSSCLVGVGKAYCVSGIVLTGGMRPHATVMRLIKRTEMPVILVEEESYEVASSFHDLTVKIQPSDVEKIQLAQRLVERYVDVDAILAATATRPPDPSPQAEHTEI
ncbi:MAG: AAA family ATPase [Armatimonadetes bacterium]|jgi:BioD-like phosphotransacetylase family protein|nr:AAA family ATPase [Armatimonadota bacterium]